MNVPIFNFEIITPTKNLSYEVEWIEVESPTGNFIVCANHYPLISIIKRHSTLRYKKANQEECSCIVSQGIFKTLGPKVTVILDEWVLKQ